MFQVSGEKGHSPVPVISGLSRQVFAVLPFLLRVSVEHCVCSARSGKLLMLQNDADEPNEKSIVTGFVSSFGLSGH